MGVLMFAAPVHFLLMDRRRVWGGPFPVPLPGYWQPVPAPMYQQPVYQQPQSRPVPAPVYQQPQPQSQPAAAPPGPALDELQQLGELLRRQAEGGGR